MVIVTGGSSSQKRRTESLAKFCIHMLIPRIKYVDVLVQIKDLKGNAYGYCLAVDNGTTGPDRPRTFVIDVDKKLPLRKLLETVAHEMVHVKQYAQSELYMSTKTKQYRWQGKWIKKTPNYWDRPWEIDAHGRETGLFIRWAEKEGIKNAKWAQDY